MKKTKKRIEFLNLVFIIIIVILISYGLYHYGFFKKSCKDAICFDEAFKKCRPARYTKIVNNNYYDYVINGKRGDNCLMKVTLKKMGSGTSLELIELFEGKSMDCKIPLTRLPVTSLETEHLLGYCHGLLKEAIYEQVIQKLYGLIVQNLGDIISDIRETMFKIQ